MKKLIIIGLTFIFILTLNQVDSFGKQLIQNQSIFGIKAGANLSTLNGQINYIQMKSSIVEASSKINGVAGAYLLYKFTPKFAVQPELLFSMKGANFDADTYVQTWSMWYLEVPILFKSIFPLENENEASVFIGPALSYNIWSKYSQKFNNNYEYEDRNLPGIRKISYAAVLGGSYYMKAFSGKLEFDARYTYDLVNIQDAANIDTKNGAISLTVGYLFNSSNIYDDY